MTNKDKIFTIRKDDAVAYGANGATFLYRLRVVLEDHLIKGVNIKEGYVWSEETREELLKEFPFWSKDQLRRIINKLKSDGAILTADLSSNRWHRATSYSMPEYKIDNGKEEGGLN